MCNHCFAYNNLQNGSVVLWPNANSTYSAYKKIIEKHIMAYAVVRITLIPLQPDQITYRHDVKFNRIY